MKRKKQGNNRVLLLLHAVACCCWLFMHLCFVLVSCAGSKYEHKRSKTLLKVKTFYDEARWIRLGFQGFLVNESWCVCVVCPCHPTMIWSKTSLGGYCCGPCRWYWSGGRHVWCTSMWDARQASLQGAGAVEPHGFYSYHLTRIRFWEHVAVTSCIFVFAIIGQSYTYEILCCMCYDMMCYMI